MLRLKPFQTLGMKLRQFGLGRLRRYAQDLPVEQAEVEPNWLDASEQELHWPEGEGPAVDGLEGEVQRFPEDDEAEYGEYGAGSEGGDNLPQRTPPDLAAILQAHREQRAEEAPRAAEEPARRPTGGPGTRRVSRQPAEDAGGRTTPPAVLSDLPRPRRSRESVIQELLGGRGSDAGQAPSEPPPAPEETPGEPEAFLQTEWTPDESAVPEQPERWTPDAPATQQPAVRSDAPQIRRQPPREPASTKPPIRRQPAEADAPDERGRARQMAAGPVSISETGEVFPAEPTWTPPAEDIELPSGRPAAQPGDVNVRRQPVPPQPDPAEPLRRRIDRQAERREEAPQPPRPARPHPEAISEETPGERPSAVRRQPASPSSSPQEPPVSAGAPYYDAPAERPASPLRYFEEADMDADTDLIVPMTPPPRPVPPQGEPRHSEMRRAEMPSARPTPEPVEPDSAEDVDEAGGVEVHEVDLYEALLSQGLIEAEPPRRSVSEAPPVSRQEGPRVSRSIQRQSDTAEDDEDVMARLRGRRTGEEVPPSGSSDAEAMARLRGRRTGEEAVEQSGSTEQEDLMALLGLPPETPVVGGEVFQGAAETNSPSEIGELPESEGQDTSAVPLDGAAAHTQGAGESAPEEGGEGGQQQREGGGEDVDIDKLARDVYTILRDRLRIEQERKSGRL